MATIQIRNIPDEDYAALRDAARRAGKSLQSYMREEASELARRAQRLAAVEAVEDVLRRNPDGGLTKDEIVAEVRELRGE